MKSGNIPKDIKVFIRGPIDLKFRWDDIGIDESIKSIKCNPVFVTDDTNKKTQATAQWWATGYKDADFETITLPNDPFGGVRIIGLDIRGNGGRAWQVLLFNKYLVDMREDVLMDAMLHDGVGPGGKINGQFMFAMVSSEMKLIRVGSLLHSKMVQSTNMNNRKSITDYEIGGVYTNKHDAKIYLGHLYTTQIKSETQVRGSGKWDEHTSPSYYNYAALRHRVKARKQEKVHVFVTIRFGEDIDAIDQKYKHILEHMSTYCSSRYEFHKTKPKSLKTKIFQIPVDEVKDVLDNAKTKVLDNIIRSLAYDKNHHNGIVTTLGRSQISMILNVSKTKDNYINEVFEKINYDI